MNFSHQIMQNAEVVWVFHNHFPGALPEPHNLMSFPDGMRQAEVCIRCTCQAQTSERLAFKSDLQVGYARHFGLGSNLNSAVVISVLASHAF